MNEAHPFTRKLIVLRNDLIYGCNMPRSPIRVAYSDQIISERKRARRRLMDNTVVLELIHP